MPYVWRSSKPRLDSFETGFAAPTAGAAARTTFSPTFTRLFNRLNSITEQKSFDSEAVASIHRIFIYNT